MRVLAVVVAPAGHRSGRLLHLLSGKPLLAYTADAVLRSRRVARAVLATDSPAVAELGEELGLELVPPGSPAGYLSQAEAAGDRPYDAVLLLPAVHPLRSAADIDGAIQLLDSTGADAVASFTARPPSSMKLAGIDPQGRVLPLESAAAPARIYVRDGSITCLRRQALATPGEPRDCRAWLVPPERVCAVEEDFDLFLAEQLLRYERRATA